MMTDPAKGSSGDSSASLWHEATTHVVDLLTHYGFDLGGNNARQLIDRWQSKYSESWVRWAVIEALYQGRYKAVSVEQILQLWQRRQQPCYHFNYEFERLVCHKFPRNLAQTPRSKSPPDTTILPDLPAPSRSIVPSVAEPPPWVALAEQIQQENELAELNQNAAIAPLNVSHLEPPEILLDRVARLQAGVEALIEQATSSLNASTEAMKTKLQAEENKEASSEVNTERDVSIDVSSDLSPDLSEDVHPPIHQFMPAPTGSEFHTKLKAVVEQEAIE
ncbi:MAG: hypothetical protein KME18_24205 [Phormidium tanganyikae FI6-MK23]|jgi:hypothetical protein|nr:hypothetical protein [Phormidium tanganyikae FI6-MK23]